MIRVLSLAVLTAVAGPGLAQERLDLGAVTGSWSGSGQVTTVSSGEAQELRCRVTIEAHDGNTRFRGRCASTAGNRRFSMAIVENGDTVTARSLLQGDAGRDTTVTGGHSGGGISLASSSGSEFGLRPAGGGLMLTMVFTENGERYSGEVVLAR